LTVKFFQEAVNEIRFLGCQSFLQFSQEGNGYRRVLRSRGACLNLRGVQGDADCRREFFKADNKARQFPPDKSEVAGLPGGLKLLSLSGKLNRAERCRSAF
jgi:hypothetical protein